MTFTESCQVETFAPFNFDLTAHIFSGGDTKIRSYANGKFSQVPKIIDQLELIQLTSAGTVNQPKINVEIKSNSPITSQDKQKTKETIKFILNLDLNLNSFYNEIKNDRIMNTIAQQFYGLKNPTTPTVFEALMDSIVEQQISLKVAHTIENRLIKEFGETLILEGETYYVYPTPQKIANVKIRELNAVDWASGKPNIFKEQLN